VSGPYAAPDADEPVKDEFFTPNEGVGTAATVGCVAAVGNGYVSAAGRYPRASRTRGWDVGGCH